jgi:LysM repeat protein
MSAKKLRFLFLASVFALLLLNAVSSVGAQSTPTLVNPGFESPFVNSGGIVEVQVAQGWTPWNVTQVQGGNTSENQRPDYLPASNTENSLGVPRIDSGADAQQYFSFFATHVGGVFQRVTNATAGVDYTFSVRAYVWSTSFDDVGISEEDGGVIFQVGIDPTGGTNGESGTIVWSSPSVTYDAYNSYSVTARATGTAITVFVRSSVSVPVKSTTTYIDTASLNVGAAPVASPTTVVSVPSTTPIPPSATNVPVVVPSATSAPIVQPSATTVPVVVPSATTVAASPVPPTATSVPPTVVSSSATPVVTAATAVPTSAGVPTDIFPGRIVHTVRSGETVSRLATLYGSTTQAILAANGLDESALIFVGQGLVIPVRLNAPATSTPTATPQVVVVTATPAPAQPTSAPPAPGGTTTYVVQPGDTLFRIATRFNTTTAAIAQLNGIVNQNRILVGQTLVVPVGAQVSTPPTSVPSTAQAQPTSAPPAQQTYVVRPGDNLFRISVRFNVSISRLIQANGIRNADRVFVGQTLVIP